VYSGIIATVDQISDKYVENGSDTFYLLQNPEEAPGQEDWRRYASDGEYENKLTDIRNEIYDSLSGYTYSEPEPEPARQTIQKFDWFDYADYWFERQSTAMVTDVLTGKVFDIFRIGGSLHADIVPFTAADTATFKSITGDWTWERRPVWITHNGETSAASIHSQPHTDYPQYFNNNDMYGHVCLHFLNSRTHEDNAGTIEAVDARHQACVSEAYQAGWR